MIIIRNRTIVNSRGIRFQENSVLEELRIFCKYEFFRRGGCEPLQYSRTAAKRRCNTRGQASENNKFNLPRKQARLRATNSSTKTQTANQNTIITKTKNFIKHRLC